MRSFVHSAMVWLGITDDDIELDRPVMDSSQARSSGRDFGSAAYAEPRYPEEDFASVGASPRSERSASQGSSRLSSTQMQNPAFNPVQVVQGSHGRDAGIPREQAPRRRSSEHSPFPPSENIEEPTQVMDKIASINHVIKPLKADGPKVHLAVPSKFADVQEIADHMKGGRPVIVNIEGLEKEISRRVIDFCSGLTYALGGKIRKVAEQVYLITPSKVEVTEEDMERITERAVFRGN